MKWFVFGAAAVALMACGDDDADVRDAAAQDAAEDDAGAEDSGSVDATADSAADSAVMSCGPVMGRTGECDSCLQAACCSALNACGGDPDCVGLVTCLRACDEPDASTECMSACVATHGVSPAYNPLLLCGAADCAAECPFTSP